MVRRVRIKKEIMLASVLFIVLLAGIIVISFLKGDNDATGRLIASASVAKKNVSAQDCAAVICEKDSKEVYCPDSVSSCEEQFDDCREIKCYVPPTTTKAKAKPVPKPDTFDVYPDEEQCTAEYNDCYDDGEAIVCKGDYDQCCASFENCVCGTGEDTGTDAATPDLDSEQSEPCSTGVFVCAKQTVTMSGDIAESKVTCKGSFQQCSTVYGSCHCGNATLTSFTTQYVGDASSGGENQTSYWCDFKSHQVPCYMVPGDSCNKKSNSCFREDGIMIKCDGTFTYCNTAYDGNCLCGLEVKGYGFFNTEEQ